MFDHTEYQQAMEAIIERFKSEIQKVRTGRAHPDMLGSIKVEAYGQYLPLNQVANITAGDATMLLITPFDPSTIQAITSAIRADQTLGLNPADDGRVVRVPVPPKNAVKKLSNLPQTKLKKPKSLSVKFAMMLEKNLNPLTTFLRISRSVERKKSMNSSEISPAKSMNSSRPKKLKL